MKDKSARALERAVRLCGGQVKVAKMFGLVQSAISYWLKKRIPAEYVLKLERATKGRVTRYELRPDIYKKEK